MQLSDAMKQELYEEAQTNGLNATEYRLLLGMVDRLINKQVQLSMFMVHDAKPNLDYDVNGKEA